MSESNVLADSLPAGASVCIDSSVVLAYLTGTEAVSALAVDLFDGCLATGRNVGSISAISVTELLVRPFRAGTTAVSTVEGFLRHFADLRVIDVDYATAREAARVRAMTGLAAPDALIVASSVVAGTDVLITNDGSWPTQLEAAGIDVPVIVLRDLLAPSSTSRGRPGLA